MQQYYRLNILVFAVCIGVIGAASTSRAMQHDPLPPDASPHEVLERLQTPPVRLGWMNESSEVWPLLDRIEREPDKYAPVVTEMLDRLPERIEEWDPPYPFRPMAFPQIVERLGVDRTEPMLVKYFRDGYRLYEQADEQLSTVRKEAGPPPYEDEELQAKSELRLLQHRAARSVMINAMQQLRLMNSPAVVDDMLKFWEAGYVDHQSRLPRYPLMFAHERPDVIPRLKALMESPETDRYVKMQIKRAFEWYAATLAEDDDAAVPREDPERPAATEPDEPDSRR